MHGGCTHGDRRTKPPEIRSITSYAERDGKVVRRVTALSGADCGTDHNLLIADVKIKLKRIKRAKQTLRYDVENIGLEFAVEVKNRFNGLQLADREPEELWNDIRDTVKETVDKRVPKATKKESHEVFI